MSNRFFSTAIAALFALSPNLQIPAAETNAPAGTNANVAAGAVTESPVEADLRELVTRINNKLKQDQTNETDLADDLKEFDVLVSRHKDAKAEDRAHVLVMKAQLYLQVLDKPENALEVFKQIRKDFPDTQVNGNTDELIKTLQAMIDRKKNRESLVPGSTFPDFNEKDLEGRPLSISNYKGKVVLVDFWATWCGPCIRELPQIQQSYDKFHGKGFEIVGVSLDEDKARLEQFVKQRKMAWPEFFDGKRWENKLAVKYGVDATPTGYLIDREGKIIAKLSSADDLESQVSKALEK